MVGGLVLARFMGRQGRADLTAARLQAELVNGLRSDFVGAVPGAVNDEPDELRSAAVPISRPPAA
jgi:hypothetical protein